MKYLSFLLLCINLQAAGISTNSTLTLPFKWIPSKSEMAGLSTNDYCTNIVFNLLSTTDITTPTNQWSFSGSVSCSALITNQGPVGTIWTNQIITDGSSRFYMLQTSNTTSGTVSPFSNQKPWYQPPLTGIINQISSP